MNLVKIQLGIILWIFSSMITIAQEPYDAIENALAGSVTVAVYKTDITKRPLGFRGEVASDVAYEKALDMAGVQSSGSGFVIQQGGKKYVITNAHVIEKASDEAGSLFVFSITRNKYEVKIVGGDSFYDIAVLEFVQTPGSEIKVLEFKTEEPRIGERVYAIGNPLGEYPYTVTDGIISAKNRVRGGLTGKFGFLQTTATVIWGNSGGPLIDSKGKVAGVNSQIAFTTAPTGETLWQSQINFALEADITQRLVNDIITNKGLVKRAYLGIELSQKYRWERISYNQGDWKLMDERPILSGVIRNSPVANELSGYIGYQIIRIGREEVRNLEEALGELEKITPGSAVEITFMKDGKETPVRLNTKVLTPKENEDIARHVMAKNTEIKMDFNGEQVSFTYSPSQMLLNWNNKYQKGQGANAPAKYHVLAAGVSTPNYSDMWKVLKLSDLGASLRLSGLSGVLDFYVVKAGDASNNVENYRINFSGNDNILQKLLWY
ncbi:MAG: S1C family serine protease [Flavobacteriales bacterium]|nr:S1C family serine protease [Flavobacteriales bacterium]